MSEANVQIRLFLSRTLIVELRLWVEIKAIRLAGNGFEEGRYSATGVCQVPKVFIVRKAFTYLPGRPSTKVISPLSKRPSKSLIMSIFLCL